MPNLKPSILFAICAWSLLILRFGYRYGTGDQVELLPYTLFLHDASLYPHDFFIHGLNASVPNERTVMAYLLLPFVNHLEIFCFIFQFITTIVLVMGLEKLAGKFIQNKYLVWLAVLTALIPLNDFALGNVDIYSECLQASGVAAALVVWAINGFLEKKFIRASVIISVASFIQLLEGPGCNDGFKRHSFHRRVEKRSYRQNFHHLHLRLCFYCGLIPGMDFCGKIRRPITRL